VAIFALLPAATFVCIIGSMAAVAGFRRVLEDLRFVTVKACSIQVIADQGVICRIVIKRDLGPGRFVVAIRALRTKTFLVNVILYVTGNALAGSIPMLVVRFVTVHTGRFEMFSKQLKIGEDVIERVFIQPDNVGIAALMICMAGRAFISSGSIKASVKTVSFADIAFDILMTIKAKRPLFRSAKWFVTGRTFRLNVSMITRKVSGHDQGLNSLSSSSVIHETAKHHNKSG
jgi:hypothetical protein